ncbi:hypothetical protein DMA11_23500 [Marinilabiliaceae bacterium JC017]|nr:hypothetical protein DMA11_23500 [Marinilabiliaceae bacterium JC017]
MKTIIKTIFSDNGFEPIEISSGTLFHKSQNTNEVSYWLVVQSDELSVLDNQEEWAVKCQEVLKDPKLNKNLSLLVLKEFEDGEELLQVKQKILNIEEDPYFFKKYVLYYSKSELSDFKRELIGANAHEFLLNKVISQECFNGYKRGENSWKSLLYRIASKVPFIKLNVAESKGLKPLFEKNEQKLQTNDLKGLHDDLMEILEDYDIDEIKQFDQIELLNLINPKQEDGIES